MNQAHSQAQALEWTQILTLAEKRFRTRIRWTVGGMLALYSVTIMIGLYATNHPVRPQAVGILLGSLFATIGFMVGLAVFLHRKGVRWLQASPLLGVDRARRRVIRDALKTGAHLEGNNERMARDTALRLTQFPRIFAVPSALVIVGWALGAIDQGMASMSPQRAIPPVFMLLGLGVLFNESRKGRRYLSGSDPETPRQA